MSVHQLTITIQLKTVMRYINQWCTRSGVHWDNVTRATITMEAERQDFMDWLKV